ncbi:MAG: chorismate mutase [Tissierellia bacterium]|nr:chorismate mutase [Tissierellia bacterium]
MELDKIRREINNIDKEIVKLLEKRFNIVIEAGLYKRKNNLPIYDEERERQVVESCINLLEDKKHSKCIDDIFFQIMRSCKDIQNDLK